MIKFKKFISIYEGGANHKKFPLPAFLFLILILSSSFFISCENLITQDYYSAPETKSPEQITENKPVFKYADFTGRYTSRGALPSEINSFIYSNKSDDVNDGIKSFFRSAMPVNGSEKNEIRYYAIARAENEADVNGTVNETERTFSIPHLKLGIVWTVEVGIQVKNIVDSEEVWKRSYFAMEELPMLTESLCHQEKNFALKPDTEGSGSIDLNMTVDSSITSVEIRLSDEEQRNRWDAAIAQDPNKIIDTGHIKLANLQTGSYDLTILFKKASENFPSYTTNQTINVLNGMVTDRWFSDGTLLISDTGTFELNSTMISEYVDSCIYVGANQASASVSNNNEGKAYSPLETLQEAISRISSANQSRHYTIFVSGNVTGAVNIEGAGAATLPAASITIIGLNGLDANNYPRDCINGNGSSIALKINTGTIKVNIKDLQISGATAYCLRIDTGSDVTLNAGVLIGSAAANPETRANYGIDNSGKLRINGSKILGNKCGIYSHGDTSYLEMSGGKISNNYNTGVMIDKDSSEPGKLNAKFYGTEISYNGNSGDFGGGVQVRERTVTQFYNCSIKNNEACRGGGFYSQAHSLSINNCRIENNYATENGGGLWIESSDELILSNTTIKNNFSDFLYGIADGYGGALYIHTHLTSFKISGNIDIPYGVNGDTGQGKNDVGFSVGNKITISGPLTCPNPIVLIPFYPIRSYPLIEVDDINVTSITPYKDYFVLSTNDWLLKADNEDKALELDAPIYVAGQETHPATGKAGKAAADGGNGTKSAPFATIEQAISAIIDLATEHYTIYVDGEISGAQTIPDTLTTENAYSLTIQGASGNTNDILNGNNTTGSVLTINSAVPVTIKDLKITGGKDADGAGIKAEAEGEGTYLVLDQGSLITENHAGSCSGGGVNIIGGTLIMRGNAEISECNGTWGGGIRAQDSDASAIQTIVRLEGNASIKGCTGSEGGGIGLIGSRVFLYVQDNAEISGNTANTDGGGIRLFGSTANISGGLIKENKAVSAGGAVSVKNDGVLNLSGSVWIPEGVTDTGGNLQKGSCKNDIYLADSRKVTIAGALTPPEEADGIVASITPQNWTRGLDLIEADNTHVTDLTSYKDYFALTNADDGWNFKLSSDNTALKLDAPIYVAGQTSHPLTGKAGKAPVDGGTGEKSKPFDTIANACDLMSDSTWDYTILVDGTITRSQISARPSAHSITLKGANSFTSNDDRKDIINAGGSGTALSIPYILSGDTSVPVTIENLKITGGAQGSGGAGIHIGNYRNVTLGDDLLVQGNNGAGVYVSSSGSTLNVKGNVVVSGNTVYNDSSKPCNVYLPDGKTINVRGALKEGDKKAQIGISTENPPTLTSTIAFTTNYGTFNSVAPGTYFTGDQWTVTAGSGTSAGEAVLAASGGSITIEPIYEDITISINKSSVLKSATEKKFTFTATGTDSEGNSSPITIGSGTGQLALTIDSVTYHGEELTESTHYTTGANYVTLDNSLPAGNYTINTRAVYQGSLSAARTYSAGFEVKIVNGIQVTASNIDSLTFESGKKYYLAVDSTMTSSDLESLVNKIRESPNINDIGDSTLDLSAMELPAGQLTTQITLNNANITEIIIPDSLTSLWGQIAGQFQNNKKLITVTYNGTNRISWNNCTFQGCTSLKNFPWHALDTFLLGNQVFGGCTSLESVTIPADIEQICPTFDGCSNLKEVHFLGENPPYMQDDAFADCHPDLIFYVPSEAAREAYLNFTGAVSIDSSMKGFANPDVNPYATTPENLAAHVRVEGQ